MENYILIILQWILFATISAIATLSIALCFKCYVFKNIHIIHWWSWILTPLWLIALLLITLVFSLNKNYHDVLKRLWIMSGRNLMGDYSNL